MKITVTRSGGFAGIPLPPKTLISSSESVIALTKEAYSSKDSETSAGFDMMGYDIYIEDGEDRSEMSFRNRRLPNKVEELVDLVMRS